MGDPAGGGRNGGGGNEGAAASLGPLLLVGGAIKGLAELEGSQGEPRR